MEYNRIKRENEELKRIIGMIALDLEQEKKKSICDPQKINNFLLLFWVATER